MNKRASKTEGVDAALHSTTVYSIFERRIEFRECTRPDTTMEALRAKYKPINEISTLHEGQKARRGQEKNNKPSESPQKSSNGEYDVDEYGFVTSKRMLFPRSRLSPHWSNISPVGPGLRNLGQTSYLNAVLQCLVYTAPLANYLLLREHRQLCPLAGKPDFCILCFLQTHVVACFKRGESRYYLEPTELVAQIKNLAQDFQRGREEDAYTFLQCVINAAQRSCLLQESRKVIDPNLQETTLIHQLFGLHTLHRTTCIHCKTHVSAFSSQFSLSLPIVGASKLAQALRNYFVKGKKVSIPKCEKCLQERQGEELLSLHKAPMVLAVHLQRFSAEGEGKVEKKITFDESIELTNHLTQSKTPLQYRLNAVLTHQGASPRLGHYACYIKSSGDVWYNMDDENVRQVGLKSVLEDKGAYILFYVIEEEKPKSKTKNQEKRKKNKVAEVVEEEHKEEEETQLSEEGQGDSEQKSMQTDSPVSENVNKPRSLLHSIEPKSSGQPSTKHEVKSGGVEVAWNDNLDKKKQALNEVIEREANVASSFAAVEEATTSARADKQYGSLVGQWDEGDVGEPVVQEREKVLAKMKERRKRPSDWDAEYDRGKQKKVRQKGKTMVDKMLSGEMTHNPFQKTYDKEKKWKH
ncbi:uncharacterized protein VTP21DRAFT_2521 [Calcarisporiella thermophila]|uniref:uncharacterized protein n=1 Tax=Calcarisporiella thermophila TaxID=911321 RepID=UPI0037438914